MQMIKIPFSPYDKAHYSVPWCGVVMEWNAVLPKGGLRPPTDLAFIGQWVGTAKDGGYYRVVRCRLEYSWEPHPGIVLRWGQRNKATNRVHNEGYGITLSSSTFKQVDKMTAWEWFVTTRSK